METTNKVRILLLEENLERVRKIETVLQTGNLLNSLLWVKTQEDFLGKLEHLPLPQIILSGWKGSLFDGVAALDNTRKKTSPIPFLFAADSPGERAIIETFRHGAADFVLSDQLSAELIPAIIRAIHASEKRLGNYIPICSHCKKIREGAEQWIQLERYFMEKGVLFTHSICPTCREKVLQES